MTQPPPPEQPGGYPPPAGSVPPPGYYPPGYFPPGVPMPPAYMPHRPYASWGARVGAYLLDGVITFGVVIIPVVIGLIIVFKDAEWNDATDEIIESSINWGGFGLVALGGLAGMAFTIWNRGIRVGVHGQSLGKKIVGIEVVSAESGQYLGAGMGFLRMILDSILGNACFLNYLWPLWDEKHQTWHDMIVKSIVLTKP